MSTSSAFWALFFGVQLPIVQAINTAFGLTKLAAAACMQCTAQRLQKAANTSLLESRSLLQTATLVFPRPVVCSRLSNNINILAKKNCQAANGGGGHGPPAPSGSATVCFSAVRALTLDSMDLESSFWYVCSISVFKLKLWFLFDSFDSGPERKLLTYSRDVCTYGIISYCYYSLTRRGAYTFSE